MGDVTDSSQSFTISLEVPPVPEGELIINQLLVNGIEVYPTANPVTALKGDSVIVSWTVTNIGGPDNIFVEVRDDIGLLAKTIWYEDNIDPVKTSDVTLLQLMPASDWNLTVNAGHEE